MMIDYLRKHAAEMLVLGNQIISLKFENQRLIDDKENQRKEFSNIKLEMDEALKKAIDANSAKDWQLM